MAKTRYAGGMIDKNEKGAWQEQAKRDGFDNLWAWLKYLARKQIKEGGNQ